MASYFRFLDLPQEIRIMIYQSCFGDHESEAPVWVRPRITVDEKMEGPGNFVADWRWGILVLSSLVYSEAIAAAYSSNTFAIVESSTAFLPVGHKAWHHLRSMALGGNSYPYAATSEMIDKYLPILRSSCSRLERLDIFIDPDEMLQVIPCLTRWIASYALVASLRLAMKVTVTGDHQPDLEDARDLLYGRFGEPDKRSGGWSESPYSGADWPRVSKTVEHMPNAGYITFHTTDVSVGEEEVLDTYCAWGFHLAKVVHQKGTHETSGAYTYTWEKVEKDEVEQNSNQ